MSHEIIRANAVLFLIEASNGAPYTDDFYMELLVKKIGLLEWLGIFACARNANLPKKNGTGSEDLYIFHTRTYCFRHTEVNNKYSEIL